MHASCLKYLEGKEVSVRFKRIVILHLVAAAVGRKVYLLTRYGRVFPAPITGLVGMPGSGKSQVISPMESVVRELAMQQKLFVAPRNMTVAGLADSLYAARRTFDTMHPKLQEKDLSEAQRAILQHFHHLSIFAPELGVMTGKYDPNMLQTLSNLYDCEDVWDEGKRSFKDKFTKEKEDEMAHVKGAVNPIVPVLFGTQPRYMTEFIPVSAWEQGFAARAWFVYAPELAARTKGLFEFDEDQDFKLHQQIVREVERLSMIEGRMQIDPKAAKMLEDFYLEGDIDSAPKHSLLASGWNSRRTLRLEMYSMMYALCRRENLCIEPEDVETVLGWMLEDEQYLVKMLEDIGTSADSEVMRSVWEMIRRTHGETNNGVPMTRIRMFIAQRGDVHKALKYIRELEEMGAIRKGHPNINGIEDTSKSIFYPAKGFHWNS